MTILTRLLTTLALVVSMARFVFADCVACGDANGDGAYTFADVSYILSFLYSGGPAPAECADFDGYDLITIRDALFGLTMTPPMCVDQPKIIAQPTTDYEIWYINRIPSGLSSHEIFVYFRNNSNLLSRRVKAFDLPLLVRIDGSIPQAVFATSVGSDWPGGGLSFDTDFASGAIIVSDLDGSVGGGYVRLFKLTVQMPPSLNVRTLTLEYAELAPTMSGIYAPPNSACHYVMVLDQDLNAWQPSLVAYTRMGDADHNGIVSISDSVFIINYIFAGGPAPLQVCQGDSDNNGIVTISDAVYLISYIFGGGPGPIWICAETP